MSMQDRRNPNFQDPFPVKLHSMLDDMERMGNEGIVSWNEDGRSFSVHDPKNFAHTMIRSYFNQTKYKSFQRQLNLYKFERVSKGKGKGAYSHPLFLRDGPSLAYNIRRHSKKKVNRGTTSSTSSKESSSLSSVLGCEPDMFESMIEAPETVRKEQPSATGTTGGVDPIFLLRTNRIVINSDIGGKTLLRIPSVGITLRQQNAEQIPNFELAPNSLLPSQDKQQGLSGIMPSFGQPFLLAPPSSSMPTFPRLDYSDLVDHDDDSSIESIEEIPSDYLVDLEEDVPSNVFFETRKRASYVYEI